MITIDNKPLQLSEEQEKNIRLEIAVMLYEKADYSFYVAAKFAGLHWMDFVKELGKREISIYSEETFFKDLETIKKFGK
jgi:predicted HTH domain antitoxin